MADGLNIGSAHVTIHPDVNHSEWVSKGQQAGAAFAGAASGIQGAGHALKNFGNSLIGAGASMRHLGMTTSAFITLPVVGVMGLMAKTGLEFASSIGKARSSFQALLPTGYDVEALLKRLADVAVKSPVFDTADLIDFAQKMTAVGTPIGKTEKLMDALGNIFLTFGVTAEGASGGLFALQQMMSKGKVTGEELNRQWANAIPGGLRVFKEAAQVLGVSSIEELSAATQQGTITMDQLLDALIEVGNSEVYIKGATTAAGNLASTWQAFKESAETKLGFAFDENREAIIGALTKIEPLVHQVIDLFIKNLPTIIELFGKFIGFLGKMLEWFEKLSPFQQQLVAWGIGLAAIVGPALVVLGSAISAIGVAVKALGIILLAVTSPVGLVVLAIAALAAGLIIAWQKSETFRDIVKGTWEVIQKVVKSAWEDFLKPIFEAIGWYISNILIPGYKLLWEVVKFVWNSIQLAIDNAWNRVIKPVFIALQASWETLGRSLNWVWNNLIKASWDAMGGALSFLWHNVIHPVFNGIKTSWETLGNTISFIWNSVIRPAWDAFHGAISFAWSHVIRPVFDGMKVAFQAVGDTISWVWNHLIAPAWNALHGGLQAIWQGFQTLGDIAQGVFQRIGDWASSLRNNIVNLFSGIKDAVVGIWHNILHIVAGPINSAIDFINNAVISPYNAIPIAPDIPLLPRWNVAAQGGLITGPGTSTSDSIPTLLSNGEYVLRAAAVDRIGVDNLHRLNAGLPALSSMGDRPLFVTVLLDGEPIVRRARAVVDANNEATISALRSGRRFG